jgi:hypothetical protein
LQIWAFFIGDDMEYNKGYIAIHRVIRTHWLWDKNRVFSDFEAWLDLIMFARWEKEPTKQRIGNKLYTVGRGEQIRSIKTLSKTWNWSASKTRRFLVLLESDGMIALKSDSQTTHVTICNYDTYQKERIADESQVNRIRIASEFQVNTIEERKERKEGNKGNNIGDVEKPKRFSPPTLSETQEYFVEKGSTPFEAINFYEFYGSKGWKVGSSPMKDWKMAASRWIRKNSAQQTQVFNTPPSTIYT